MICFNRRFYADFEQINMATDLMDRNGEFSSLSI